MAVVTESFCIREYTDRMRSVDLRRCWPFGVGREDTAPLPSISIRRFKWWTDELDTRRSEAAVEDDHILDKPESEFGISEGEDVQSPARTAMEVSSALPAEEDAQRPGKGKQKTPKKRSIVELFAAVPLIAGAVDDVEEDSGDVDSRVEEGDGGGRGVVHEEEIEMDVVKRKTKGIKGINIKKKKERKKRKKGITKGFKLEIRALKKKKTRMGKSVRKHKVLQTPKPFPMNKEVPKKLPVRSILKDQKRSKIASAKAANLIKLYCESNKHVTFSIKEDKLGSSRAGSAMDFPQMQNLCKIFSDVLAASSAINHPSNGYDPVDANGKLPDANSCENGARKAESSSCKNQSTVVNSSNSSCSGTERASFAVMVDLNRAVEANDYDSFAPATSALSSSCAFTGDPTSRAAPGEKNLKNSGSEVPLKAGLLLPSEPILVHLPAENFIASSNAASSLTHRTYERHCQPHVDAGINFCRQSEGHQPTKGLLSGMRYSMGSKRLGETRFATDSVSTCKNKCSDEDFIGLPLNSQGELIQFHSGTKFNEAYKKQNISLGSNPRKNHLELTKKKIIGASSYPKSYYSTKERVRHWLNFTELDGSKRLGIQRNEPPKGNDRFLHSNSNSKLHEYRNGPDLQTKCNFDYHAQHAVQPTMRLMGKNVVVGGISGDCHAFNDRRTSKKNENFIGQTRFSMFPDKPLPQQWIQRDGVAHTSIGRSIGNPFQVSDSTPKFYNTKSFDPSLDYMHNHQPHWPSRSCDNHIFMGDMEKHMLPSQAFPNNSAQFLPNYISGEGSVGSEHHYPAAIASHPQNSRQNILTSPYGEHDRRIFHGELPMTMPQFQYQDYGKFSPPPPVQPSDELPRWLLNAKEQKRYQIPDPHYSHLPKSTSTKKMDMNGIYSNFMCFKAHNLGKRPVEFDDGITNPAKRSLKGNEISSNFQQTNGNCAYGNAVDSCSARFDNESRSGPIKLIGGAKHILKPCQVVDDENCRPIHSTIIFPGNTTASFGAEKKFANIYKF